MTNLYRKAMAFEKGHSVMGPDKAAFLGQIDEIKEKVDEIFKLGNNSSVSNDIEFKN